MSAFACGCASEDCVVNGCRRWRELQQPRYQPMPPAPGAFVVPLLTEQDVRRIVREELERIAKPTGSQP